MNRLQHEPMKVGTLGQRKAGAVNATAADKIYARWRKNHGERQASYAMQVCRLVWNWAVRHHDVTGVTFNPFSKMALSSVAADGNRPTSRAEYDLYRETARSLGWQAMATAAALSFELCQRVWDVFGFVDPDGIKQRGFVWADYKPGISIGYSQSKTGKPMYVPLYEMIDGERIMLFPDLEDELARDPHKALVMVVDEKTGMPFTYEQMNKRHRKICDEAKLPRDMTFTGFRHGGSTELGDAGIADVRPITGHTQLNTTAIYNKLSEEKARQAASVRLKCIRQLSESLSEQESENTRAVGGN
ncbi:MAG TPA: tyrosine-type recombinase/integrase [Sphingobium sp.]|uniref:tyrosine-type recombinase/integrase n=1 Tax=Sphingobium sp. TaxID=1912891 RepID=UPI002ED1E73E